MSKKAFAFTGLTGGTSGTLDSIPGDLLYDGNIAVGVVNGITYTYYLDDDSSLAESSPNVISPDTLPGTKRWILSNSEYIVTTQAGFDALSSIVTNTYVKLFPGTYAVSVDMTIPTYVSLYIPSGVTITVATTKTLTINGPFIAKRYSIFSLTGTGAVAFGSSFIYNIYPEWWGIDGTADEVQINKALASLSSGRGIVLLGPKTYTIAATITPVAGNTLRGAGKRATNITIGTAGIVAITPTTSAVGIDLEDFGITGTDPGTDNDEKAIYATTCTNLHVRRVFVEKVPYGVKLDGCIRSSVTDSDFFDTAGNTTQGTAVLLGADAEEIVVSRNTFKTIKRHAVYLSTGTRNSVVSANAIDGCGEACINMNSDSTDNPNSYNTITGNTMRNGTASGIYMQNYCQYNTVTGNIIETVGSYGIGMTGAVDHATERPSYNVISGNIIKAPTNHGIWISNGDENIVTSNLIETSAQTGIVITTSGSDVGSHSYRNTVANNIVRNSGRGLNISGNATTTRIAENTLYNNTTNNYYLAAGTGTLFREVFYVDNTDHATSGTGEDTLATVTIPAYYLGPNGVLKVTAAGTKTGANGNKTIKIYWNNNAYTFNAANNDVTDWRVEMTIANTALGTQRVTWTGWNGTTITQGYEAQAEGTNAATVVKLTGECAHADDVITQTMLIIERL